MTEDVGLGLHSSGMHNFVVDELELGFRTAASMDDENNCGWPAVDTAICVDYLTRRWPPA